MGLMSSKTCPATPSSQTQPTATLDMYLPTKVTWVHHLTRIPNHPQSNSFAIASVKEQHHPCISLSYQLTKLQPELLSSQHVGS